jgi:hypothetical protein
MALLVAASCGPSADRSGGVQATPVYDPHTGRLEQLAADRSGRGRIDTRAYMDGVRFKYIEIDRKGTGRPDRWEYYQPATSPADVRSGAGGQSMLVRAEEANGSDGTITRWEYYEHGVIARVEEDTDGDGRVDKWEQYAGGALVRMDLDLSGRGYPDRRLVYRGDGTLDHMEIDANGDGRFKSPAGTPGQRGGGRGGR